LRLNYETRAKPTPLEILIVEDSRTQAEQLKYMLEEHDFHVVTSRNGREALDSLRQRKTNSGH